MQYRVVSKGLPDDSVIVDTIYTIDFNGKCFGMSDEDGDSIPDSCGIETSNNCGESGSYKKIDCDYRRKNWFKIGSDNFKEYLAGSDLTKKWQLGKVIREHGLTKATYSCGEYCQIDLIDSTSDGMVDEAYLTINLYSVSFVGDMPYPAHEMLQRAVLTAFEHFMPGTFSKTLGEGVWEVGILAFAKDLSFAYNPYFVPGSSITFEGKPLSFAPDVEVDGKAQPAAEAAGETKAPTSGESHMFISESGGEPIDVTDDYSEYNPQNLGVVPLQSTGESESD